MGKRKVHGHGTRACYIRLKCQCKPCLAANAKYVREWRWATGQYKPAYLRPIPEHGTTARYGNPHRCRCTKCRRANADDRAFYKQKRKAREEWML